MTSVAIGDCHAGERGIGNMGHRLTISGRVGTTVTGSALVGHRHLRVIPLRGFPDTGAMAADAIDGGWDMRTQLPCSRTSVMATGAVRRGGKQTVIRLGTSPTGGGLVTGFAHGLASMDGSSRPTRQSIGGTHVTRSALPRYRY
jgi:hypothetical protein